MAFDTSISLIPDASTEANWRAFARALGGQFAAMGLVKTADSGQINLDQADVRALTVNPSSPVANAFDLNAAVAYQSTAAPSTATPQWVEYDAGVGNTFTPASWAVYTSNLAADPKDVILQSSDNPRPAIGAPIWTNFDPRALTASTGYQAFNLTTPPAKRAWRMAVNSTQGASAFVQVSEFQLWTGASQTLIRAVPIIVRPTASNQSAGFEMYRMNDVLQPTAPAFLKIEYGTGASPSFPSIWLQMGNATDGAGNLTGINPSARQQLACSGNVLTPQKCVFSGNASMFAASLFYNSASHISFGFERSGTNAGVENGDYVVCAGRSGGAGFSMLSRPAAAPPPALTEMGCYVPSNVTTSADGADFSPLYLRPWKGNNQPPLRCFLGYFNADFTAEVPYATIKTMGSATNRTYFPIGNSVTGVSSNANVRLMVLAE